MTCAKYLPLLGMSLLFAASTRSGQSDTESREEFVCISGPTKKVVTIYRGAAASDTQVARACRVDYTKEGKTETLWTSTSSRTYCTAKALALVTKLAESNYTCKPQALGQPDDSEVESAPVQ